MTLLDRLRGLFGSFPSSVPQDSSSSASAPTEHSPLPPSSSSSPLSQAYRLIFNDTSEEIHKRLELRDIFRDEQLFNQLLPRAKDPAENWQKAGVKTWVDQWSSDSQFIPMDSNRVLFSSALSGLMVSAISTPFDVVKNFWIHSPRFRGVRSALSSREVFRSLYEQNGLKSLYTGFGATCCVLVPSNLIFFYVYEHYKYEAPPAMAGVKARTVAVVCTMPAEYIRTRLQANVGELTSTDIFRTISAMEGLRSYSKGVIATFLRDAPFSGVYWTLNEKFKTSIEMYDRSYREGSTFCTKFLYPFLSGASAAAIATTMTQPFDVIKTNIQGVDNLVRRRGAYYRVINGVGSVAATIWKSQGLGGFFVGLAPRLAKIIPCCAFLLASYDFAKATFTVDQDHIEIENF